jgi:hypothetical protein
MINVKICPAGGNTYQYDNVNDLDYSYENVGSKEISFKCNDKEITVVGNFCAIIEEI